MSIARVRMLLAVVATTACGGGTIQVGSSDGGGTSSGSGSATSANAGPGEAWTEAGPPADIVCDTLGQRRDAMPNESAQYCVCEVALPTNTWLIWRCYGPPPGSPNPSPKCNYEDFTPGTGNGSCWANWASCSDGQNYSLSCADRICSCLVNGHRTPVQIEPRDTCPPDQAGLNALCGWNLHF
jgi:hypothetical protein